MLINGKDLNTFSGQLLSKDISNMTITTYDDWLRQSISPLYFGSKDSYRKITLVIIVEGDTDEDCITDISNLTRELAKCTIKFDDLIYTYNCTIQESGNKVDRKTLGCYSCTFVLQSDYAYGARKTETISGTNFETITVEGNSETPVVITLTPNMNYYEVRVGWGDKQFTINNVTSGVPVIINGEDGTVTENGVNKFADYPNWEFPKISPGNQTIVFSSEIGSCIIEYNGRWV